MCFCSFVVFSSTFTTMTCRQMLVSHEDNLDTSAAYWNWPSDMNSIAFACWSAFKALPGCKFAALCKLNWFCMQVFGWSQYAKSVFDQLIVTPMSVCLSVTRVDCAKTKQRTIIIIIIPPDSSFLQLRLGKRLSLSDAIFDAEFQGKDAAPPLKRVSPDTFWP